MDPAGAAGLADLSALDDLAEKVADAIAPVYLEQAIESAKSLEVNDKNIVHLLNTDALNFARDRGAEMVGKKWMGDLLVDNPDARWAITETTRDGLRRLVVDAYEQGFTPARLKEQILASYDFSVARAKMIARTETAIASTQGTMAGWRRSGMVEAKRWITSMDHEEGSPCECDENEEAGAIALDEDFPSGDDGSPAHPNCNCVVVAILSKAPVAADEDEDSEE
jgi:hypothetical protein